MTEFGRYILTVAATGIIVSIAGSFFEEKSSTGVFMRVIGGLLLCYVILKPVAGWDMQSITAFSESFDLAGEESAQEGSNLAREAMAKIIIDETQAYILDKATSLHAQIQVEVILSELDSFTPHCVNLTGAVSPHAKAQLQQMIEQDIGIPKERQRWIG